MGKIEKPLDNSTFITPDRRNPITKTFYVRMKDKMLDGDFFRKGAEKSYVEDIAIICDEINQIEFNILVNKIKSITVKPTFIYFRGKSDYEKYRDDYVTLYRKRFPDNVFIMNILKEQEANYQDVIKKRKSLF